MTATVDEKTAIHRPPHVPPELVFPRTWDFMTPSFENVFETRVYAEHLTRPPVYWCPDMFAGMPGAWIVRRYADLQKIYLDDATFSKQGFSNFAAVIGETWNQVPAEFDGEAHTEVRRVLNETWSPGRVLAVRDLVQARAQELIDGFKHEGRCEFVKDFAVAFPVWIFLGLMGLPREETPKFLAWKDRMFGAYGMEARIESTRAVKTYLTDAIEQRRKTPTKDLITEALSYDYYGKPWTDDMIFGYCFNLFIGGLDTVTSNLSKHVHHLATHLDHQAELRADPRKLPMAVEELLRAYASVTTLRTVTRETEFCGVKMMPGDKVAMSTGLTGRDPEAWDEPNEIRFDRKPKHHTFGGASHRCLGIHLARQEIQLAIGGLLSNLPEFRVDPDQQVPLHGVSIRQLPLVWDASKVSA